MHNTRDKYSSQSSKNIDWDANHKRPPPPAPGSNHSRNSSSMSMTKAKNPPLPPPQRGPPVVHRDTRPNEPPAQKPSPPPAPASKFTKKTKASDSDQIDWGNLSPQDKKVFFGWLDQFFERKLKIKITPRKSKSSNKVSSRPVTPSQPVSNASPNLSRQICSL